MYVATVEVIYVDLYPLPPAVAIFLAKKPKVSATVPSIAVFHHQMKSLDQLVAMVWITTVTGVWIVKIKQETATTILIVNVTQRENDAYTTVIAARTGVTGGNANNYKNISKL
jgi:hypothetical protein